VDPQEKRVDEDEMVSLKTRLASALDVFDASLLIKQIRLLVRYPALARRRDPSKNWLRPLKFAKRAVAYLTLLSAFELFFMMHVGNTAAYHPFEEDVKSATDTLNGLIRIRSELMGVNFVEFTKEVNAYNRRVHKADKNKYSMSDSAYRDLERELNEERSKIEAERVRLNQALLDPDAKEFIGNPLGLSAAIDDRRSDLNDAIMRSNAVNDLIGSFMSIAELSYTLLIFVTGHLFIRLANLGWANIRTPARSLEQFYFYDVMAISALCQFIMFLACFFITLIAQFASKPLLGITDPFGLLSDLLVPLNIILIIRAVLGWNRRSEVRLRIGRILGAWLASTFICGCVFMVVSAVSVCIYAKFKYPALFGEAVDAIRDMFDS